MIPGLGRSAGEEIGYHSIILGLPLWFSWYRICLQCKRPGFDSWVGKIRWRRDRLLTPVFWSGEFHGLHTPGDHKEYIMRNARLDEAQAGIKTAGRNINNIRYADDTTLMAESKEELKSLLMKVKEESEKAGLKLTFKKPKIMASDPITSWQIDGVTMETVTDFIFLDSKITADGDYSYEIKTLVPCKKSYDQPRQHTKKQRHYFANKGPSSQSYGFSSSHVWI